jgi:hypothetical protein
MIESYSYRRNDDYYRDVARGGVPGAELFMAYGERATLESETDRVIWPDGAFTLPSAAGVQMGLASTSADDAAAGTGIRAVHIRYLDADLEPQTETVALDGLTPALTVATDIRFIQCMHVAEVGSGLKAAGVIQASNGGTVYSEIATGRVRCSSIMRMVPAGKRLLITGAAASSISETALTQSRVRIVATRLGEYTYTDPLILVPQASVGVSNSAVAMSFDVPLALQSGDVVGMVHTTDKAATIMGTLFGVLENE